MDGITACMTTVEGARVVNTSQEASGAVSTDQTVAAPGESLVAGVVGTCTDVVVKPPATAVTKVLSTSEHETATAIGTDQIVAAPENPVADVVSQTVKPPDLVQPVCGAKEIVQEILREIIQDSVELAIYRTSLSDLPLSHPIRRSKKFQFQKPCQLQPIANMRVVLTEEVMHGLKAYGGGRGVKFKQGSDTAWVCVPRSLSAHKV